MKNLLLKLIMISSLLLLLLTSCEKKYKEKIHYFSDEYGEKVSECEIKAKNDSIAYKKCLTGFYLFKMRRRINTDKSIDAYDNKYFELYDSEGNRIKPPKFSNRDMEIIGAVNSNSSEDVLEQIKFNESEH